MKRVAAGIVLAALVLVGVESQGIPADAGVSRSGPAQSSKLGLGTATVSVAVATVWHHATSPRSVDAPALANPVRLRQWLKAMTVAQRLALNGRADTQVLLGERVKVIATSGDWARVVVPDQPTPLDSRGYPGWIPKRQLMSGVGPTTATTITVSSPTTWLRTTSGKRLLEVSFGTRLAALSRSAHDWSVRLPDGRLARVSKTSVIAHAAPKTSRSLVAAARRFLGLDYLWAGASGFGYDCSGLMEAAYRLRGIEIPRDSAAQALAGRPVRRSALRAGDLIFFASGGHVHHVGMYVGNGMMLHAPHTGSRVEVIALASSPLNKEYAGARRFLP